MDIKTKEQFFDRYDKLTKSLYQSNKKTFSENLSRWVHYLINVDIPPISFVINGLMNRRIFKEFNKDIVTNLLSVRSDPLKKEKRRALIALNALEKKSELWSDFEILMALYYEIEKEQNLTRDIPFEHYLPEIKNATAALREIFVKCLEITDDDPIVDGDKQREIPASDRIVNINHNASEYQEIIEKLEELEASISKSNTVENEDKDRLQAELKAGEGILKGKTARIEVIKTLLVKGLKYIIKHVADVTIVVTAEYLLKLICQYFGLTG